MINGKCTGGSLTVHGDHTNLLIENNVIWEDIDAADDGCWGLSVNQGYSDTHMEQFPNLIIRGNTVINTGNSSIGCSLCQNTTIENNTIVHQHDYKNTGIRVPQTDESAVKPKSDQVTVRNNVVIYDTSHNFSIGDGVRLGSGSGATYTSAGNEVYYRPSSGMVAGCENYRFSPPDNVNVVAGICQNRLV